MPLPSRNGGTTRQTPAEVLASQKAMDRFYVGMEKALRTELGKAHPVAILFQQHGWSAGLALGIGTWLEYRLGELLQRPSGMRLGDRIQDAQNEGLLGQEIWPYAKNIQSERNRFAHDAIAPMTMAPRLWGMLGSVVLLEQGLPAAPKRRR